MEILYFNNSYEKKDAYYNENLNCMQIEKWMKKWGRKTHKYFPVPMLSFLKRSQ